MGKRTTPLDLIANLGNFTADSLFNSKLEGRDNIIIPSPTESGQYNHNISLSPKDYARYPDVPMTC